MPLAGRESSVKNAGIRDFWDGRSKTSVKLRDFEIFGVDGVKMDFQVQLLGRFALRSAAGDEIAVPSKKGQALIAVLALAGGAPVPREQLTGLLWSERGEAQARGSLRQALTALRRV